MAAIYWKIIGIALILVGVIALVLSQLLLSLSHKKMLKEL